MEFSRTKLTKKRARQLKLDGKEISDTQNENKLSRKDDNKSPRTSENNLRRSPRLSPVPQRLIVPRGLTNLGNTCFLNSILQCLASISKLQRHLQQNYFKDLILGSALSKCLHAIRLGPPPQQMKPVGVLNTMSLIYPKYRSREQHDAAETLGMVLNRAIIEEMYEPRAFSTLHDLMNISTRSVIICPKCHFESVRLDDTLILTLPLVRNFIYQFEFGTLYDSLRAFAAPELLRSYRCSGCDKLVNAVRTEHIVVAPQVLMFQLRRFEMQPRGRFAVQHGSLDFPWELCINGYVVEGANSQLGYNYELTAVCVHAGTLNGGHYTAYVKVDDSVWACCNDHRVYEVRKEIVSSSPAYLLFYQRKLVNSQ